MKNKINLQTLSLLFTIIPVIAYAVCYPSLPEAIPSHWDFSGNINGYSSKTEFFLLALCPFFLWLTFVILPKIDPKKENYQKFSGFFQAFSLIMVIFMDMMFLLCLYTAFHQESNLISKIVPISVGLLFIFIGNYLPKVKPNFFVGIKTPWTLSSETVWIKTHRKGGISFLLLGVFMMITPFFSEINGYFYLTVVILTALFPTLLSYIYYEQERKQKL